MAKKFRDIRKPETPERRARIEAKKKEMLAEVRLQDLRRVPSDTDSPQNRSRTD